MPPLGANEKDRSDIKVASRALLVFSAIGALVLLAVVIALLRLEKPEWMSGFRAWQVEVGGAMFGLAALARKTWGNVVERVNTQNRLIQPGAIPKWVGNVERAWDLAGVAAAIAVVAALVMEYVGAFR